MKKYSLLLLILLIPYYAFAVTVPEHPNLDFTINADDATCSVEKANDNIEEAIIPAEVTINGKTYTVTSIGVGAFANCSSLTSVEIPSSVTSIGKDAFYRCKSLTSVEIPNSVTEIGRYAFNACALLTSVKIPNSVTEIGRYAFYRCASLTSVEIPNSVTSIGDYAFAECNNLKFLIFMGETCPTLGEDILYSVENCTVYVPEASVDDYKLKLVDVDASRVKGYVEESACKELVFKPIEGKEGECSVAKANDNISGEVVIPSTILKADGNIYTVTEIASNGFNTVTKVTKVTLPETIRKINGSAFYDCVGLTSINLPESITDIGANALRNTRISQIVIPAGVTAINKWTFAYCSNLSYIFIPESVNSIGYCAFDGANLSKVVFGGDTPPAIDANAKISNKATFYVPEAAIGTYVTALGVDASRVKGYVDAADCKELIFSPITGKDGECSVKARDIDIKGVEGKLDIPSTILKDGKTYTVTSIRQYAFERCSNLTSVKIPSSVTSIGNAAFYYCGALTSVVIPSSVTSIGNIAFEQCSSLTSVKIPNSVTEIGARTFSECSSLTSVEIPNSVKSIGVLAFSGCSSLTSVEIPLSVTSIGESVFDSCLSLTSINIPERVTSIGDYAFAECNNLKFLIFMGETCPETLGTNILDGVGNCTVYVPEASVDDYKLKLVDVDASRVTGYVEESACKELVFEPIPGKEGECSVRANPDNNPQGEVIIPSTILKDGKIYTVTSIGVGAFERCSSLASVEIPNSVTSIGEGAFERCSSLTSVEIPNSVTSIGERAFCVCSALTSVEIPNSVTSIGEGAFAYCSKLASVEIPNSVTSIVERAFVWCSSLTSVKIPSSVTSIEMDAFANCSSLTSVEIPSSVTSIGMGAFTDCTQLKSLIFTGETCPTFGNTIFQADNCMVYVLNKTLVESFKANFPNNEVKPLLDINADYVKTGDEIAVTYPEGYAPEGLSYSVKEEGVTLTEGEDAFTLTGHGAATVRVADVGNENIYAETTLNVYVSGDSNDNGTVDITDAVNTANYIVGKEPEPFLKIAANVVKPEEDRISIADVVATVDIVLAAQAPAPSEAPKSLHAPANSADYLTFRVGTEGIALSLVGDGVFSALQADVTLPAGAVLNDVVAGDRLTANHSVMYRMVDDRTVRVAVFAMSLDTFAPGDAVVILDVEGMGDGEVTACNVIASDADGHGYRLGVDGGGMTGIEGVVPGEGAVVRASGDGIIVDGAQGMDVEVYGMDGRLVRRIAAGDYRVTVDVAPGVYVVRVGAAPAVKIAVR